MLPNLDYFSVVYWRGWAKLCSILEEHSWHWIDIWTIGNYKKAKLKSFLFYNEETDKNVKYWMVKQNYILPVQAHVIKHTA